MFSALERIGRGNNPAAHDAGGDVAEPGAGFPRKGRSPMYGRNHTRGPAGRGRSSPSLLAAAVLVSALLAAASLAVFPGAAMAAYTWTATGGPGGPPGEGVLSMCGDTSGGNLYAGARGSGNVWRYGEASGAWASLGAPVNQSPVRSLLDIEGTLFAGLNYGDVWRNADPGSGGAWADTTCPAGDRIFSMANDGAALFAASGDGKVYRNLNAVSGNTWSSAGEVGAGRVYYLSHGGGVLYAASADGTVYRNASPKTGTAWTAMGNLDNSEVRVLCFANGGLFAGTEDGNVFLNSNPAAGSTWIGVGAFGEFVGVHGLVFDSVNTMLYAFVSSGNVWKNVDPFGGGAWSGLGQPAVCKPSWYARPLAVNPGMNRLYAGVIDYSEGGQVFAADLPSVTAVAPAEGARGTRLAATITCADTDIASGANVHFTNPGVTASNVRIVGKTKVAATLDIAQDAPLGPCGVAVSYRDSGGNADRTNYRENAFEVLPGTSAADWYLAEGSSAWGFNTSIAIQNPNPASVKARLTYMDPSTASGSGIIKTREVSLAANSQTTVAANEDLGYETDFSTRVQSLGGEPIAVDRTMSWCAGYQGKQGSHNSIGVNKPSTTWYLPEGSSAWGYETWTLVQNPNPAEAEVTVTYMLDSSGPVSFRKKVAPLSRATFSMKDDVGAVDASIGVSANMPVIAERSMYTCWTSPETGRLVRREGHESIGATRPSKEFYLAEGSTAWGFTTYVLVQNPNKVRANVTVTYNTGSGAAVEPAFEMPPGSRKTLRVNDRYPDLDLSTAVRADVPIVAERAMYWNIPAVPDSGVAMHDSIGTDGAHPVWFLPAGSVSAADGGYETYTLVQNPNASDVKVRVSYMKRDGKGNVTFTGTVPAGSRATYNMGDRLKEADASIMVECLTPSRGVIVERSMYMMGRWSGTDTVGAHSN